MVAPRLHRTEEYRMRKIDSEMQWKGTSERALFRACHVLSLSCRPITDAQGDGIFEWSEFASDICAASSPQA